MIISCINAGNFKLSLIVQKYGGSSLANVATLQAVAKHIVACHHKQHHMVVVVSAMGKTTDTLIEQATQINPDPPRRELDMLVTAGERIAMSLLSMAITKAGVAAISLTGSQSGIITTHEHQGARILRVQPRRIQEHLQEGFVVIVAGYQGVSERGEVTTLGRGGSDTTAVALAAALCADACEIYSDVDGVYSADPRVCMQARLLPELHYDTMQHMACAGAKVLNADAVEHAKSAHIVIHARKTLDTNNRETVIHDGAYAAGGVSAVVGLPCVTRYQGNIWQLPNLFWHKIRDLGGRIMHITDTQLVIDRTGIPNKDTSALSHLATDMALSAEHMACATLIGVHLFKYTLEQFLSFERHYTKIAFIKLSYHDHAIACLTQTAMLDNFVQDLHHYFITE